MAAELYERARSERPDEDPDAAFADRSLKLATTFGGAGVLHGDLTAECAAIVGQVLDALGAKAGKDDDRSRDQRYHDALAEAMRRLVAAGAGRTARESLGAYLAGRLAWGWTMVLNPDGTTTAWSKDTTKVLHSHGPRSARGNNPVPIWLRASPRTRPWSGRGRRRGR
jgi:hypothetical protein